MQKTLNKKIVAVLLITVVASFAAAVLRLYLFYNSIEHETGFYRYGDVWSKYFAVIVAVLCVFMLAGALLLKNNKAPGELKSESTAVVFASSLCGFVFVTVLALGAYSIYTGKNTGMLFMVQILLCIPCAVNFFSICVKELRERTAVQTLLSLFPALFFAIRIIEKFTDTATQINVSQRSLTLAMLCAAMLFFVCETGFFLPNGNSPCLSRYFGTGIFTVAFAVITVLPYLVVCAFWIYNSDFLIMDILDACIGLYALTRMASLAKA